MTTRPGIASSGVHSRPKCCAAGAKSSGPIENPSVPPVMCTDIARPAMRAAEPVRERGGRRMKRRGAQAADDQDGGERRNRTAPGRRS